MKEVISYLSLEVCKNKSKTKHLSPLSKILKSVFLKCCLLDIVSYKHGETKEAFHKNSVVVIYWSQNNKCPSMFLQYRIVIQNVHYYVHILPVMRGRKHWLYVFCPVSLLYSLNVLVIYLLGADFCRKGLSVHNVKAHASVCFYKLKFVLAFLSLSAYLVALCQMLLPALVLLSLRNSLVSCQIQLLSNQLCDPLLLFKNAQVEQLIKYLFIYQFIAFIVSCYLITHMQTFSL